MSYLTLEGQGPATVGWKKFSTFIAVIPLGPAPPNPYTERIAAIRLAMGPRYIGHESRMIRKGDYTAPEVHRCDVGATFARIRAQLDAESAGKIIVGAA